VGSTNKSKKGYAMAPEHVLLGPPTGEAMFYDPQAPSAAHLLCPVSISPEWFVADGERICTSEVPLLDSGDVIKK